MTLEWTYDLDGSTFDRIDFGIATPPRRIALGRSSSNILISIPEYVSRLTVNVSDTNTAITFDAINKGDSNTYNFAVENAAGRQDAKSVEIIVQCK